MAEPDWEAAAALLGAERVILARPAPDWSLSARHLEPRDQLYRTLLADGGAVSEGVVDTTLLGDTGLRMRAAGVARVLVLPGPEPGSLLIAENPSEFLDLGAAAAALEAALPGAAAPGSGAGGASDVDLVASWLEAVAALPAQSLVSPAGANALAGAAGAGLVVFLWPGADHVEACWGGADCGRRALPALPWPLPEDHAALAAELDGLSARPPVAPWRVFRAGRGPLAVAVSPPHPAVRALGLVADLLAFDAERSRTSPEGRQHTLLEERVRIAGLIHDGVTQQVSNVTIQLQLLELAADDPERLRQTLQAAREATTAALEELRASIYELAPRLASMEDLVPSLREWCRDYSAQWGIEVTVEVDGDAHQLDPDHNMLAYAVVQECLTNVRKHAGADSATVRVGFSADRLSIEVADDGGGFAEPPAEPTPSGRRMGLRLLRDRVRSAGGALDVVSRPGEGSEVTVRLPL